LELTFVTTQVLLDQGERLQIVADMDRRSSFTIRCVAAEPVAGGALVVMGGSHGSLQVKTAALSFSCLLQLPSQSLSPFVGRPPLRNWRKSSAENLPAVGDQ